MTDLEITKACAQAMGYTSEEWDSERGLWSHLRAQHGVWYHPLHDDAQAMALVKKLQVMLWPPRFNKGRADWTARIEDDNQNVLAHGISTDLNRAICECVAKLKQGEGG